MFGGTSTAAPTFSFGTPAPAAQPAAGTSLFGQPAQQTAPTTGGLFGQPGQQQQQQPATSLFGGGGTSTTGGGLFGGTQTAATTSAAPAAGGGLFGQQPPATGTSLFGQPAQQQSSTSLFGQPAAAGPTTSLFGNASTSQPQQPSTSQFGQPQQQQQSSGLFGAQSAAATNTASLFEQPQQQQQQQQQQPQVAIGKKTKLSELPEAHQKMIEQIDAFINETVNQSRAGKEHPLEEGRRLGASTSGGLSTGAVIPQTSTLLARATQEEKNLSTALKGSQWQIKELRLKLDRDCEDALSILRITEALKTNPQSSRSGLASVLGSSNNSNSAGQAFTTEYFSRITNEMAEKVGVYTRTMEELEQVLNSYSLNNGSAVEGPEAISQTVQTHQKIISVLASRIATISEEKLAFLKDEYRRLWRERTGSVRDPFAGIGGGKEQDTSDGMEGLTMS